MTKPMNFLTSKKLKLLGLLITLSLMTACAAKIEDSGGTKETCLIFSKQDFMYSPQDTPATKKRLQNAYAAYLAVCPS